MRQEVQWEGKWRCVSLVVQCKAVPRREGGVFPPAMRHSEFSPKFIATVTHVAAAAAATAAPPRRRNHGVNRIGSTLDRHHRSQAPPVAVQYARACYLTIGKRGKMKVNIEIPSIVTPLLTLGISPRY